MSSTHSKLISSNIIYYLWYLIYLSALISVRFSFLNAIKVHACSRSF